MKRKLVLMLASTIVAGSLVGCGDVSVSEAFESMKVLNESPSQEVSYESGKVYEDYNEGYSENTYDIEYDDGYLEDTYESDNDYKDKDTSGFQGSDREIENLVNKAFPLADMSEVHILASYDSAYANYSDEYLYKILVEEGSVYDMGEGNPWLQESDLNYEALNGMGGMSYSIAAVSIIEEAFDEPAMSYLFINNLTGQLDEIQLFLNNELTYDITISHF